jgi:hypothetical protein
LNRRAFIAGALAILAAPLAARAQQPEPISRVGFLVTGSNAPNGVREALRKNGYLVVQQRGADNPQQFSVDAAELVRLKVTVIFVEGPAALKAAARATRDIPIVAIGFTIPPSVLARADEVIQ